MRTVVVTWVLVELAWVVFATLRVVTRERAAARRELDELN